VLTTRDDDVLTCWNSHRTELLEEAQAAGFQPFGVLLEGQGDVDDVLPPDAAREAWSTAFCKELGY
jgi:hypothetical protein